MADDPTPAPATPTAAPGGPATPWHQGIESDIVGTWQNKGYDLADPKTVAVEATKAYREAQSKLGVPPDQLIKLLKPDSTPQDIKAFWSRLGAPQDPKEYNFSTIKFSDGAELDTAFVDNMRAAFDSTHLPKDTAERITQAFVKHMDDAEAQEKTNTAAKLEIERAELKKNWGNNFEANQFIARQGAKVLGISPEQVTALESVIGYKGVMEAMHKVGVLNKEDRFIAGGAGPSGTMTRDQAIARKADIMADQGWVGRYMNGGVQEKQEMDNLNRIIVNYFEAA